MLLLVLKSMGSTTVVLLVVHQKVLLKTASIVASVVVTTFVSKIGAKLDIVYISLAQLVGPCVLITQKQNKYCFKLCKTIEPD